MRAIIDIGHNLRLATVAEGIEQPYQVDQLLRLGCDYGQGFLFSPPVAPAEFERQHCSGGRRPVESRVLLTTLTA